MENLPAPLTAQIIDQIEQAREYEPAEPQRTEDRRQQSRDNNTATIKEDV